MCGEPRKKKTKRITHVNSNMAHQASVMGKTNIMALIMDAVRPYGTLGSGVIINNKGALDVDLDSSWIGDRLL